MQLFMFVVGWYSCLVTNSFLACKLPINQLVEWRHHLSQRYFAHLLWIFGLPLVELFSRLLMLSLGWCFTWFVSLFCFWIGVRDFLDRNFGFCLAYDYVFCFIFVFWFLDQGLGFSQLGVSFFVILFFCFVPVF